MNNGCIIVLIFRFDKVRLYSNVLDGGCSDEVLYKVYKMSMLVNMVIMLNIELII